MIRSFAICLALVGMAAASAFAQESAPGPGTVEVTFIPAGSTFFTAKNGSPDFGNYTYGGALTYNINRFVGIEGEAGGRAGLTQTFDLGGGQVRGKSPNMLTYTGNVVFSPWTGHAIVPFATGGIGGLTMFRREALGVGDEATFLSGNVGGGLKWYAPNGRWGLRGDYRFIGIRSRDDAPAFFGPDNRYGHRAYVGIVIKAVR